jgi:hypothetical protein
VHDNDDIRTWNFTYTNSEDPWPLSIGKTYTKSSVEVISYMARGEENSSPPSSRTLTITVDNIENVTVPAGTFKSLKIIVREGDALAETRWYSDTVKNDVKRIDHQTAEVFELTSYSV